MTWLPVGLINFSLNIKLLNGTPYKSTVVIQLLTLLNSFDRVFFSFLQGCHLFLLTFSWRM